MSLIRFMGEERTTNEGLAFMPAPGSNHTDIVYDGYWVGSIYTGNGASEESRAAALRFKDALEKQLAKESDTPNWSPSISWWAGYCHGIAEGKGWWDDGDRNVGEVIALAHSELSEALEEWRNGHPLNEIRYEDGKPEGFPVEIADVFIRLFDVCAKWDIPIERAVREKCEYNATRPYRHGGKLA